MRALRRIWIFLFFSSHCYPEVHVPEGHIGIAAFNGEVLRQTILEGTHQSVDPAYDWFFFDLRNQVYTDRIELRLPDGREMMIVVSVSYRLVPELLPDLLRLKGNEILSNMGLSRPELRHVIMNSIFRLDEVENLLQSDVRKAVNESMTKDLRSRVRRDKGMAVGEVRISYFRILEENREPPL